MRSTREFVSAKTAKYAREALLPNILEDFDSGALKLCTFSFILLNYSFIYGYIDKLKKHFIWASANCGGNASTLKTLFAGAARHYGEKLGWTELEIEIFAEFLPTLIGNDEEFEKFAHGTFTSLCESFHSLANKYHQKAPTPFLSQ